MAAVRDVDRRAFRDHGVAALRGVLAPSLIEALGDPVEQAVADDAHTADMTALGEALGGEAPGPSDGRGRFRSGVDHWRTSEAFREFALRSPLPGLVADLLGVETLHLYEDSVLVKEPGTREPTVFHQDHAYFSVDGPHICTTWVPLDPVARETGAIGYVRGSHLDPTDWRPNLFVTRDAVPGTAGVDVPDLHADPGDTDLVWIDAAPGDVIVHHSRTLHGAGPNTSATLRRRAISVRYCGPGTTFRPRALTPKPHHEGLTPGSPVGPPAFPIAWPRPDHGR